MEFYAELKLSGDSYAGEFSCGLTMTSSGTAARLKKVSETEDKTVWETPEGVTLVQNREKRGGAVVLSSVLKNGTADGITVEMLASVAIKQIAADRVHRLQSFWSAEGKHRAETVEDLNLEPSWNGFGMRIEKFGNVGSMPVRKYFPFVALENSKTGEFVGIQLYCGSSWQIELLSKDGTLSAVGGLADDDFGHWRKKLAPGESFEAPKAAVAFGNSLEDVCDKLVKAQRPNISPVDSDMGIVFNEYCTTWGNPNFENIKKICDSLAGKGVKYLVIDAGWFGAERWWESVGNWKVNESRFEGGMKPIADYIRSKGMIPGLWFEPESVGRECEYFNNPEHLLKKYSAPLTVGGRRFWDMEDPWVKEYLFEKVIKRLRDCGFGYVKIDYNDTIGIGCDGAESLGEALRRKIEASREFFKKIAEEIPGIVIENCSSGGHRLVPPFMELASMASFSDAHEPKSIPIIAANLHRVIRPEQSQIWAVLRRPDSADRLHYSLIATLLGRMCLSGDICDLTKEQWAIVEEGIGFYRRAAEIIKNGKTVTVDCTSHSYSRPTGRQLVRREYNGLGLAVLHRFENSDMPEEVLPKGAEAVAEFGEAERDFSAKAWIYKTNS